MEGFCEGRKCPEIYLTTLSLHHKAVALYQKLGYELTKTTHSHDITLLHFSKVLQAAQRQGGAPLAHGDARELLKRQRSAGGGETHHNAYGNTGTSQAGNGGWIVACHRQAVAGCATSQAYAGEDSRGVCLSDGLAARNIGCLVRHCHPIPCHVRSLLHQRCAH